MFDYHVVTFDHQRAAESLEKDLTLLQVPEVKAYPTNDGYAVAVRVPMDTDNAAHMAAVKAISLGRGSHTVRHEVF